MKKKEKKKHPKLALPLSPCALCDLSPSSSPPLAPPPAPISAHPASEQRWRRPLLLPRRPPPVSKPYLPISLSIYSAQDPLPLPSLALSLSLVDRSGGSPKVWGKFNSTLVRSVPAQIGYGSLRTRMFATSISIHSISVLLQARIFYGCQEHCCLLYISVW